MLTGLGERPAALECWAVMMDLEPDGDDDDNIFLFQLVLFDSLDNATSPGSGFGLWLGLELSNSRQGQSRAEPNQ